MRLLRRPYRQHRGDEVALVRRAREPSVNGTPSRAERSASAFAGFVVVDDAAPDLVGQDEPAPPDDQGRTGRISAYASVYAVLVLSRHLRAPT